MSGTSTAWRVVVEAGPNTHLNARLGKYLSPAQHKVPIHETYLDLISPKLVEHRVYKQGLKWKTYYAHPDDVERNALGELTPTNGRTWDEIALAIKEYGSGVDALTAYVTGNSSVLLDAVQNTTLLPSATFPWLDVPVDYVGTSTVCRTALTSDLTPPVPSNGYIFG
jgi:hypothetical protein